MSRFSILVGGLVGAAVAIAYNLFDQREKAADTGGLHDLDSLVWNPIPAGEGGECSEIQLVREAVGETTDDLTLAEVESFLKDRAALIGLNRTLWNPRSFLRFSGEAIRETLLLHFPPRAESGQGCPILGTGSLPYQGWQELPFYDIPTDPHAFVHHLAQLRSEAAVRVIQGDFDMIGDYFIATRSSDVGSFLQALEEDVDPRRRTLIEDYLRLTQARIGAPDRLSAAQAFLKRSAEEWERYNVSDANQITDSQYPFKGRGLRTTTLFTGTAIYPWLFLRSEAARQILPQPLRRILIIGPGMEFVNPEMGNRIPRQTYEPFAVLDALVASDRTDLDSLEVDLLDISPEVVHYLRVARDNAEVGLPYRLHLVLPASEMAEGEKEDYFRSFGAGLPHQVVEEQSLASGGERRTLAVSPDVVRLFHPIQGDMRTDLFSPDEAYDLIICFNTFYYLNERDRVLAGMNIARALREGGILLTDNPFIRERTGDDIQGLFPLDFPLKLTLVSRVATADGFGQPMIVYRK